MVFQKNDFRIIVLMCLSLFLISCLCGVPATISNNKTPTSESRTTSDFIFHTPTSTYIEKPSNTPKPTNSPLPLTSTPIATVEPLIDVFNILGKLVSEAEVILGPTILITPNDDSDDNLAGGEYRDYEVGEYYVFVGYDVYDIARVFQVLDGLSELNIPLANWKQILPQFGVYLGTPPDRAAPLAKYWDNYNGYFIAVVGDPVWSVQIAEAEFSP